MREKQKNEEVMINLWTQALERAIGEALMETTFYANLTILSAKSQNETAADVNSCSGDADKEKPIVTRKGNHVPRLITYHVYV